MTTAAQPGRGGRRRGDRGLTTLEWLLIVAAVAGMAALAVVLVTASVEDTAERVSSPNPRVTAALNAAFTVETNAKAASADRFGLWADWESHFHQKCAVLAVLYSDAEVEVAQNNFIRATGGNAFDAAAAGYAAAADEQPANATKAQVQCQLS